MPARVVVDDDEQIIADLLRAHRRHRAAAIAQSPIWLPSNGYDPDVFTLTGSGDDTHTLTYLPLGLNNVTLNGLNLSYGTDFTVDWDTGTITLLAALATDDVLEVWYVTTGELVAATMPPETDGVAFDVQVDNYRVVSTVPHSRLWLNYDPATGDGYYLEFRATTVADLNRRESGSDTSIGGVTTVSWFNSRWSTLRVVHDGLGGFEVYQDAALIATATDSLGTPLEGTWAGLSSPGTGRDFWQNFTATSSGVTKADTFNRAVSTTTVNPCSDGGSWTVDAGTWGITSDPAGYLVNTTGGSTVDGQYLIRREIV